MTTRYYQVTKLSGRDWMISLSPAQIFFTQSTISSRFENGRSVEETIEQLSRNQLEITSIAAVTVMQRGNRYLW